MNKLAAKILIVLILLSVLCGLAACNSKSVSFSEDAYYIYLDESVTVTLNVSTRPKKRDFEIISGNEALLRIRDDGITAEAVSGEARVTVTALSGDKSAEATVFILRSRGENETPSVKDTYTVMFELGYGTIPNVEVEPGKTVARPTSVSRPNYVLVGWYLDKEFTKPYDFTSKVVSNLVLYAKWEITSEPSLEYRAQGSEVYISGLTYRDSEYDALDIPAFTPEDLIIGSTPMGNMKITGILAEAFKDNKYLKRVSIPESVQIIGESAFENAESLESVVVSGGNLTYISKSAFKNCAKLTDFVMPNSVERIGESAFYGATLYAPEALPESLSVLDESVFYASGIVKADLSNIVEIKDYAFRNCANLTTVINTDNLNAVGGYVFASTKFLSNAVGARTDGVAYINDILIYAEIPVRTVSVTVKPDTRLIASRAFYGMTASKSVVFTAETPPKIGTYVFNTRADIIVPAECAELYRNAFPIYKAQLYYENILSDSPAADGAQSGSLEVLVGIEQKSNNSTYVVIKKYSLSSLTAGAAPKRTANIKNLIYNAYGENVIVKTIRTGAFADLENLEYIIIPPVIENIAINAFNKLPSLKSITIEGAYGTYAPKDTTLQSSAINPLHRNYLIIVPAAYLSAYKAAWTSYTSLFTAAL